MRGPDVGFTGFTVSAPSKGVNGGASTGIVLAAR